MTAQTKTTWQKVKLGDVLDFKYGFSLPAKKRVQGDFPVYGSSGVDGWHNKAKVEGEGIIVGRKGNVGATYYSEQSFFPIDTVYYVDELKKVGDLKFFYYLLKRIPFKRIGSDVGVPGLNRDLAYGLDVTIPEGKDEQKRIASILSAFDDKIELNNKINRTLEQMVQAIFKEWFVTPSKTLSKGWIIMPVKQLVKRLPQGKTYKPEELQQKGNIPVYDQSSGIILGYHNDEPAFFATTDKPVAIFGDHTCRMKLITHPCSLGPNVVPFVGIDYPTMFIYFLTQGEIVQREYKRHWTEFEQQEFVVPSVDLAEKYVERIKPMVQKIVEAEKENQSLASLRDLLLPKLMSGRIRI